MHLRRLHKLACLSKFIVFLWQQLNSLQEFQTGHVPNNQTSTRITRVYYPFPLGYAFLGKTSKNGERSKVENKQTKKSFIM